MKKASLPRMTAVVLLVPLLLTSCSAAQLTVEERPDSVLQQKLEALIQGFHGDVGIYVCHLPTGRTAAIRADELFPTASMIKVPIMCSLFDTLERGKLTYNQTMMYPRFIEI